MTTIWNHYTLHLSTSLHHQISLWGGHLTKFQSDPKDDQMSRWPDIVPFMVTRCFCQGVCLSSDVPGTSENLNTNDNPTWRCQSDPVNVTLITDVRDWPDLVTIPDTNQMPLWGYVCAQMYQVHLKIWYTNEEPIKCNLPPQLSCLVNVE